MIAWVGPLLIATGVLHVAVGAVLFAGPLAAIVRDGVLDAVGRDLARGLAFWFVLYGPVLVALGRITQHAVATADGAVLAVVGWSLLGMGVLGAAAIPVSGFWILIALAMPLVLR
jgi:uncharacterized protein DUF6463